ncbi:lipase chaperone LimK [Duganella sp. 1411]|uniref:lipase secretion chaperone n=1 Tax=Duganella sp. 1411 TaxID=2806572 RepID=UPI001AE1D1B8|nr:lipase secretion chaperone [Duganella sp. 1411]MBP1204353.1 lipase chaperone LimK [Duganella sp. 1411]
MNTTAKKAGIAALLLAGCALYFGTDKVAPPAQASPPKPGPGLFAFVPSMAGTRPDGDLRTLAGEQLVVDAELGHLFDYYLAGLGEKDLDAIRSEIERELDRRLKPGPARQAKQLLGSYLGYKQALAGVEASLPPAGDMAQAARARLLAMRRLRPAYFTPEQSAGLFGAGDAQDDDAVARLEIDSDKRLDAGQKKARLAELDQRMPAALREEREAPARILRLEESVARLRANGAGDNEVYRVRAAALSPEAAARLAEVDRDEAAWKARIGAYLAQRAALMAQPASRNDAALQHLRDASFSVDEQRRLGAYEPESSVSSESSKSRRAD